MTEKAKEKIYIKQANVKKKKTPSSYLEYIVKSEQDLIHVSRKD